MTAALRSPFNLSAHLRPTVGDQKISYVGADHMGWMLCDGRTLSTTDHGLLFGVIGYTFDVSLANTSNFKLPDFRGTVPGMAGAQPAFSGGSNPTIYAIGDKVGEQLHRLNIDEMPAHTHGASDVTSNNNGSSFTGISGEHFHTGTTSNNIGSVVSGFNNQTNDTTNVIDGDTYGKDLSSDGSHTHAFQTSNAGNHAHFIGSTGGSNFHNNMQPTLFAGNMFIYSGKNMQAYFPYTWVGNTPNDNGTAPTQGRVLIF